MSVTRRYTRPSFREIAGTDNQEIYRTTRVFRPGEISPGYAIPLPPGRWRLVLHFAEIVHQETGRRSFDVLLQGKPVLTMFEPAQPEGKRFEMEVSDGFMEVRFIPRMDIPVISAIEIEMIR